MQMFNRKMSRRQPWHPKYRVMKDESGAHMTPTGQGGFTPPPPAPTPPPPANNGGGNSGQPSGESNGNNNGGQEFDPSAFWNGSPGGNESAPPSGESAGGSNQSGGQPSGQPQQTIAEQTLARLEELNFGDGIMNDKAIAELAEGKLETFNQNLGGFGKQIVGQTLGLIAPLMAHLRNEIRNEFRQELNGTFQQRDNDADLVSAIPSAKDPAVKKTIQPVFDRAMQIAKGDRKAAIGMTKDMLRFMAQQTGDDIGLPPRSAGDNDGAQQSSNVNWLEELTGRT
jgi:hypothetical protein